MGEGIIKALTGQPEHLDRAEQIADAIVKDYPIHLHSEIVERIKDRLVKSHENDIDKIRKA